MKQNNRRIGQTNKSEFDFADIFINRNDRGNDNFIAKIRLLLKTISVAVKQGINNTIFMER